MKLDLKAQSGQSGRDIPSEISIGEGVLLQNKAEADLRGAEQTDIHFCQLNCEFSREWAILSRRVCSHNRLRA